MTVRLAIPVSDADLVDLSYRLAEAVGADVFALSWNADLERGQVRRALERVTEENAYVLPYGELKAWDWLNVNLMGRYYGIGYERGNLWDYVQVAEWLKRNLASCTVFYGGDSGGQEEWTPDYAESLIAHWAAQGGRPYFQRDWMTAGVAAPICPLCERPATQYGIGGQFASWNCDACGRQWVWSGGAVRMHDAKPKIDVFAQENT